MNNKVLHPRALEPMTLLMIVFTSVVGAIIGMQLITSLGISANTSIVGAIFAMILGRIPIGKFIAFKSVHRQNIIQTAISAATFSAASSLMLPIGIPYVLGYESLVLPLFIGVILAMFVDALLLYKFFDTKIFPAAGTWPPGIATAEAIKAGDKGGKNAKVLIGGVLVGIVGSVLKIPMSAFGVAFIGNIWALTMFGIGLLLRGYSVQLFNVDLNQYYIPHGIMIGAGIVALFQVAFALLTKKSTKKTEEWQYSKDEKEIRQAFGAGFIAYLMISLLIALLGGIISHMSFGMLIAFIVFATIAAFVHELIVGIAAMHAGWFPAFAVAFITLIVGILIGFPPPALALLAGYSAATGVAFADMGYDLKTGYILRGHGSDPALEKEGRKQQMIAGIVAFSISAIVVLLSYKSYFAQDLVAPVNHVYAATIQSGVTGDVAKQLMIWAIPGALIQLLGGSKRQMGILFATGLLLVNPLAGWAVLIGILLRIIFTKVTKGKKESEMTVFAAGVIAGDALYSFFSSIFKMGK
ncbi:putative oligopeptide transporter (OPT) family protein [Lysinibacillus parviboronicapiens]|uniref:Oligopeptide transporter (OPT) family protein n=1 Tax=Lysinibacillus parviboronicapiens TaxID=436516 RepID=A0ABV2PGT4_9BACI